MENLETITSDLELAVKARDLARQKLAESEITVDALEAKLAQLVDPVPSDSRLNALFRDYSGQKVLKNKLEEKLDVVDVGLAPLASAIVEMMTELGYQKIAYEGKLYHLSVPRRPAIIAEKRREFVAWLFDHGEEGIIEPTYINSNTLWGWCNRLEDAEREELVTNGMLKISEEIKLNSPRDYKRKRKER